MGQGVEGVAIGDRVFGEGADTYAESAVLSAWALMPEGLSFEEAAGTPRSSKPRCGSSASGRAIRGRRCWSAAPPGGVGSAVLQIARDRGIQ